ncbi:MAG TPA: tyrosine-protein phosphatase [Candidatus Dormibacteraeota bacterium]|nr:tyrosine-protein phosphatase [Candidatus Dormibacteraeota bacterium]
MELAIANRRLDWPDCRNTRDLGGLPRRGGVTPMGVLVRSDNIAHLTPAGREALTAYGVTTVIDLRTDGEVSRVPNPFADGAGPVYRHRPLIDDSMMVELGAASGMFERYLMMLDGRPEAFRAIFEAVDEAEGGAVFHCFAGKDRTGLVAAMLLSLAGVPDDAIASDFAESDAQLAARYQEWIAAAVPERRGEMREEFNCPPDRILGVLEHLTKKWGGVPAYLEGSGMKPESIDRLGAKLA